MCVCEREGVNVHARESVCERVCEREFVGECETRPNSNLSCVDAVRKRKCSLVVLRTQLL